MANTCSAVVISANGTCGPDAVPLYEAGERSIYCVIEMEVLGQLTVSRASLKSHGGENCSDMATYGCVSIYDGVKKVGVQAQSGQAYVVDSVIHIGRCRKR